MKKGRHRRFEEARKLKQTGPDFLFADTAPARHVEPEAPKEDEKDDEYAEIAARYGAFDEDDDDTDEDDDRS